MASFDSILTYIKNVKLTTEDAKYLLSSEAQGRDCISAALRAHVRPQMVKGGKNSLYNSFREALNSLSDSLFTDSEADMEKITDAFKAVDENNGLDYADIFESFMQFSLYEIYSRNEQEGTADDKKKTAIDILSSLFGDNTTPYSELEGGGGGDTDASQVYASVSTPTDEEVAAETHGFRIVPRSTGYNCG